jgi:hypothetical protein
VGAKHEKISLSHLSRQIEEKSRIRYFAISTFRPPPEYLAGPGSLRHCPAIDKSTTKAERRYSFLRCLLANVAKFDEQRLLPGYITRMHLDLEMPSQQRTK